MRYQELIKEASSLNIPVQLVSWKQISILLTALCVQNAPATQTSMLHI